jgi:hypothetical protein
LSTQAATEVELDAYRSELERFVAEREEEYYLHFAGHKPTLDLESVYERHPELTDLETVQRIGAAVSNSTNRELYRFGCEAIVDERKRELAERLAELEATLDTTLDGETIGYRMLPPTIANSPDRARRQVLDEARNRLTEEHLAPLLLEAHHRVRETTRELGAKSVVELYREPFGFDLDGLAAQCAALLASTEELYETWMDRSLRETVGVGLAEARRWDIRRWMRSTEWDEGFPAGRMLPALEGTLAGLGIDLAAQANVELDIEERPTKDPRAFCVGIEVPGRVVLVIQPMGGVDDWLALFHEAGHTEHFANTSAALRAEERLAGDNAVTEGWAALLERLVVNASWLSRLLSFPKPAEFERRGAIVDLFFARRYSAKLLYERELYEADDPATMASRYVELLGDALKIEPSPTDYLADVDDHFYCTAYLRSWAFEAQMSAYLRERWGTDWFTRREAGSLLRELWELGQQPTADELLKDVTGAPIEFESVAEAIRASLV